MEDNKYWNAIKRKFEEDPVTCIMVASAATVAAAKLIDVLAAAQGRRAYAKQVEYRVKSKS